MGLLEGKVALITGAGGGLGREYALAFAREGAAVVVNDLGGARDGTGATDGPAQRVVAEIEALGGRAVASTDSVTDPAGCAHMVALAAEHFGGLDVVVNNAGILRDKTFRRMPDDWWDTVLAVHLAGTKNVTKAALEALIERGGGAIVNTTSISAFAGNFGQSNYGAAKAGIFGMSRVLANELQRLGVRVNCVAPIAKTRMTADLERVGDELRPECVAPMVVFLASDLAAEITGRVFGVRGQRMYEYVVQYTDGVTLERDEPWTAQEIAARLDEIARI